MDHSIATSRLLQNKMEGTCLHIIVHIVYNDCERDMCFGLLVPVVLYKQENL